MIEVRCASCGMSHQAASATLAAGAACPYCGKPFTAEQVTLGPTDPPSPLASEATLPTALTGALRSSLPQVPGYEILKELGRGGMGVVYKARQLQPRRLVALKMILAGEHAAADDHGRFRREAEAVARLQHPAIIRLHQVGEWQPESGPSLPYLTLEYVEGESLGHRLASGKPIPSTEAAALVSQLALGTHYAHTQGIVHRDLKPANVLLAVPSSEFPVPGGEGAGPVPLRTHNLELRTPPKIVDFGLAKMLEGTAESVGPMGPRTQTGAVLGTPSYMAPEQADGKGRPVGPAVDIYALGAILYECLAGRPPFVGDSTLDTLMRVVKEEPAPIRRLRPHVSRDLEKICLKCLEKEPAKRYATAQELADDLGRFLAGEPVRVRAPGPAERLGRALRRHRELTYLVGGAALTLLVVAGALALRDGAEAGTNPSAATEKAPIVPLLPKEEDDGFADARGRMISRNNLIQIGLALHNFHDTYGYLPPPAILSKKDGKPLLSWRVAILPYIEQDNLFKLFKLDEPWDSPHNKALIPRMPKTYETEGAAAGRQHVTRYQATLCPGSGWEFMRDATQPFGAKGTRIQEITDGTSNTLLAVEAGETVTWTEPADVNVLLGELPRLGGLFKGGFHAVFADGHVDFLRPDITADVFRLLVLRQDGTPLPEGWNDRPGNRGGRSPTTMKAREPGAGGGFGGGGPPGAPGKR